MSCSIRGGRCRLATDRERVNVRGIPDQATVFSSLQAVRAANSTALKCRLLLESTVVCPAVSFELGLALTRPSKRQISELKWLKISPAKKLRQPQITQLLVPAQTSQSQGLEHKVCPGVVALSFQMQGEQKSGS